MQLMVLSDESLSYWATNFHLRSILFWGVAGLRNITEIFLHVYFFIKGHVQDQFLAHQGLPGDLVMRALVLNQHFVGLMMMMISIQVLHWV